MIDVLKPTISAELGRSETTYAVGYLRFGRIVAMLGARPGYFASAMASADSDFVRTG